MQFRLTSVVTVSAYTTVEANSLEAAIEIATTRPVEFGGGPYSRLEHWLIDEADGSPSRIESDDEA